MIKINLSKAKEITKIRLRIERKPLLEKLDIDFMIALESGDTKEQEKIKKEKQRLRDITSCKELTKCKKVEDLSKIKV